MNGIVVRLDRGAKRSFLANLRTCNDARWQTRYRIVWSLAEGLSATGVARVLGISRSTVYRVAQRFRELGEAGLIDRREENGPRKLDEGYLSCLLDVVSGSPWEHGWRRPTWTQEMLIETLRRKTTIRVSCGTMCKALKSIGARRGRPKPTVESTWSQSKRSRRLRQIRKLVEELPPTEVALYVDEVDIHLNPKIGYDWMVAGQQKTVATPGKNVKRYLAGAQEVNSHEVIWVERERKHSLLFIQLLWKLVLRYAHARRIHVILDNYSIHHTEQVKTSLQSQLGKRIELHYLPPYCPDDNKIERTWQDLHANVTRNHSCNTIDELMDEVRSYLRQRNRNQANAA